MRVAFDVLSVARTVVVCLNFASLFKRVPDTSSSPFFLSLFFFISAVVDVSSLPINRGCRGIDGGSPKVKVGVSPPGTWSASTSSLAQGATILGRLANGMKQLPADWRLSPVSRTITLANPLDGNFNRYNWNRKTGRNADCPILPVVMLYRALQFARIFQITIRPTLENVKRLIGEKRRIDSAERFRVERTNKDEQKRQGNEAIKKIPSVRCVIERTGTVHSACINIT